MKITKQELKQIIKEEISRALKEGPFDDMDDAFGKEKKAPKAKCPANPTEAKSTAIAALKATKGADIPSTPRDHSKPIKGTQFTLSTS